MRALLMGVAVVAASLASWRGAAAQNAGADTLPIISRLEIEGNSAFTDDEIERAISSRASGCNTVVFIPFCWLGIDAFKRVERLSPRELRTDLVRLQIFYFRRGYRQATVDTAIVRYDGSVDVTLHVDEGPAVTVREVQLAGFESVLDSAQLLSELPLATGSPFSEIDLTASRDALEHRLRNAGYADAQVLVHASLPSSDSLGAYVVLEAEPGVRARFGEIAVQGAGSVSEADVRRLLTFGSGDVYNQEEIIRSQRALYSMALFDYVDITRVGAARDSFIDLEVQVNEALAKRVQFGFGLTTAECFQLEANWTHRNFLGGTRVLSLTGAISNLGTQLLAQRFPCNQAGTTTNDPTAEAAFNRPTWRLSAEFQQPWFLGSENWLGLKLFGGRQVIPDIYATTTLGADAKLTRMVAPATPLSLTYHPEWNQLDEGSSSVLFCINFGVCRPEDVSELSKRHVLAWLNLALGRSRTDAVLNPTRGYRLTVAAEHASRFTGSDWEYYRGQGEVSVYRNVGLSVFAFRLRGGIVRPIGTGIETSTTTRTADSESITHPLKRMYAGGGSTVRGSRLNLVGPKVLFAQSSRLQEDEANGCRPEDAGDGVWVCDPQAAGLDSNDMDPRPVGGENGVVANFEWRFPLSGNVLQGAAFVDVGRIWSETDEYAAGFGWSWSPGIGIRYMSPVGPLRLDVGYNTDEAENLFVVSELDGEILQLVGADGEPVGFRYDPYDSFLNRLQLHLSIGQAF